MINLQFHITNRCNQRCKHCYHDSYEGEELSLQQMKQVVADFVELAEANHKMPRISITGGEPFIRTDILDFLEFISSYGNRLESVHMLTNGSLLTQELLDAISGRNISISSFQLSLEGDYKTNDSIRGRGTFMKIFKSIELLRKNGFPVKLSATFSKRNYKKLASLSTLLKSYGIFLALRRIVPMGGAKEDVAEMLAPQELRSFYRKIEGINEKSRKAGGRDLFTFFSHCASSMLALEWPDRISHHCEVKERGGIVIMPNGDFYPCRVLPVKLGNILEKSMSEIYDDEYAKFLKNDRQDEACSACPAYDKCRGGAACMSYAVTGDMFAKDPQCWYN